MHSLEHAVVRRAFRGRFREKCHHFSYAGLLTEADAGSRGSEDREGEGEGELYGKIITSCRCWVQGLQIESPVRVTTSSVSQTLS